MEEAVIHRPRGRRIVDISFSTGSKCWSSLCSPEGPFLKEIHAFFFALLELMLHSLICSYQSLHLLLFLLHACKSLQSGEKKKKCRLSQEILSEIFLFLFMWKKLFACVGARVRVSFTLKDKHGAALGVLVCTHQNVLPRNPIRSQTQTELSRENDCRTDSHVPLLTFLKRFCFTGASNYTARRVLQSIEMNSRW